MFLVRTFPKTKKKFWRGKRPIVKLQGKPDLRKSDIFGEAENFFGHLGEASPKKCQKIGFSSKKIPLGWV